MIRADDQLRLDALFFSPHHDGSAVGIAARNHQDIVSALALIARKDIGWQVGSSDVA